MTIEEMVHEIQNGSDAKKEYMLNVWEHMHKFIVKIARRYIAFSELDDLVQEGYIALCVAVDTFDINKGTAFISHLGHCVSWHLQRYNKSLSLLPEYAITLIGKYKDLLKELEAEGKDPTDDIIMKRLNLTPQKYKNLQYLLNSSYSVSLQEPISEDGGTVADLVPDTKSVEDAVIKRISEEENRTAIWQEVGKLPDLEAYAIEQHYRYDRTYEDIAKGKNMLYNQIRDRSSKGLRSLRSNKLLREIAGDYDIILEFGLHGTGLTSFMHTGMSSTEFAAFKLLELEGLT